MGLEWIAPLLGALAMAAVTVIKGFWGTSEPQKTKVEHAKQDVKVTDGKTDRARLHDLGL